MDQAGLGPTVGDPSSHASRWSFVDGARDIVRFPGFATEAERLELVDWALVMRPHLMPNPNGPFRAYRQVQELPTVPDSYNRVRRRLTEALRLPEKIAPEPSYGWYLSIIDAGGQIQPHIDEAPVGCRHLRCNLFLQLPFGGGLPVIEGRPRQVAERDILAFFPSERPHRSQIVEGERSRIICSFGFLVHEDYGFAPAPG
jgi:hypothetical protein